MLEDGWFPKDIDIAANIHVPAVDDLALLLLFAGVDLFDIVFGIFDNDLMGVSVESVNHRNLVSLPVLDPPGFEPQAFDII